MFERLLAPLLETLRPHFDLSKTRLETLAVLLVGLANCRTVNLSHLASQFPGYAKHESNYRRLQRFFQFVHLDGDVAARLIMQMLNLNRLRWDGCRPPQTASQCAKMVVLKATKRGGRQGERYNNWGGSGKASFPAPRGGDDW
jgi:hypothetical protein